MVKCSGISCGGGRGGMVQNNLSLSFQYNNIVNLPTRWYSVVVSIVGCESDCRHFELGGCTFSAREHTNYWSISTEYKEESNLPVACILGGGWWIFGGLEMVGPTWSGCRYKNTGVTVHILTSGTVHANMG